MTVHRFWRSDWHATEETILLCHLLYHCFTAFPPTNCTPKCFEAASCSTLPIFCTNYNLSVPLQKPIFSFYTFYVDPEDLSIPINFFVLFCQSSITFSITGLKCAKSLLPWRFGARYYTAAPICLVVFFPFPFFCGILACYWLHLLKVKAFYNVWRAPVSQANLAGGSDMDWNGKRR